MDEGLIIKLYRERAGLTQAQLGLGICSVTHVSKIERGHTQCSTEIINLLCERLNIDLQIELGQYELLEKKLHEWLEVMVKQQMADIDLLKQEIENNTFVYISEAHHFYRILLARYFLLKGDGEKGWDILKSCQAHWNELDRYEKNLLEHTLGMYYLTLNKSKEAIHHLKNINSLEYNNHEFYFHLASASHNTNAKVKSYYYGNLALSYFRKTNNFKRILDSELLMLAQMGSNDLNHFEETIQQYQSLIKSCRTYQEEAKEINVWHNLGVEYFSKEYYKEAVDVYKKVLEMCKSIQNPNIKISALRGYVHSCLYIENLNNKEELKKCIDDGQEIANQTQNKTYEYVFHLLDILLHDKDKKDYYPFLENTFLPHLRETGNSTLITLYEKELFQYYRKTSQYEKASGLAVRYIEYPAQ